MTSITVPDTSSTVAENSADGTGMRVGASPPKPIASVVAGTASASRRRSARGLGMEISKGGPGRTRGHPPCQAPIAALPGVR